jgi:hypothetical protein
MAIRLSIPRGSDVLRNVNPGLRLPSAPVSRQATDVVPRRSRGAWLMWDPRGTYRRFVRRLMQAT